MKAIVFGAGKIARGFIGQVLEISGNTISFVDANATLVSLLNQEASYQVHVLGDNTKNTTVKHYKAYHVSEQRAIYDALSQADVGFVSVGGNGLRKVGEMIGQLYQSFGVIQKEFSFITCENVKDAADILNTSIISQLDDATKEVFERCVGTCEAVIMRTATTASKEEQEREPLSVWVQDFWELPINKDRYRGPELDIIGVKMVENFGNYLTQKMYTNNTSNAVIAYNGLLLGYEVLAEAANSPEISKLLDSVYQEINQTLIQELNVSESSQLEFSTRARAKYTDPIIVDRVARHGKDPIRKLGPEDRLIAPARMAIKHGIIPETIIDTIAKALFFDVKEDASSQELQLMRKEKGVPYILETICKLNKNEPLYTYVINRVKTLIAEGVVNE